MLIIKRADSDDVGAGSWEPPGGKLDFGENLEAALAREIKEEVGLEPHIQEILYASSFMSNSARQVIIVAYRCSVNDATVSLSHEHSDYLWATNSDLVRLLPPNVLKDLKSHKII